ncbi:MAG: alkaline phosphatase family protein, partial [Actinomycetota bacterium]
DLLYVNYKIIDKVGHRYSFPSRQMSAAVRGVDAALGELIRVLDRTVGPGQWVLALTADHGLAPKPKTTGAVIIDNVELARDLQRRFDGAMQSPRPTQTWIDMDRLRRHGHSLHEVARYLMGYTRRENTADLSGARGNPKERLFAAAFPSSVLEGLPCVTAE